MSDKRTLPNTKVIPNNFEVTNNSPIDTRYWIDNIDELDEKIPLQVRYEGLNFFVSNDNEDKWIYPSESQKGFLYMFEKDLTKPIKVSDMVLRYDVHSLNLIQSINGKFCFVDENGVVSLENELAYFLSMCGRPRLGTIITIENLGGVSYIATIKYADGYFEWKHYSGELRLNSLDYWSFVDPMLRKVGAVVYICGEKFITNKDLELELEVPEIIQPIPHITNPALRFEDGRYYQKNGILFQSIGGNYANADKRRLHQISRKVCDLGDILLSVGQTPIQHNLNTNKVEAFIEIIDGVGASFFVKLDHTCNDLNSISLISSMEIRGNVVVFADF